MTTTKQKVVIQEEKLRPTNVACDVKTDNLDAEDVGEECEFSYQDPEQLLFELQEKLERGELTCEEVSCVLADLHRHNIHR